MEPWKRMVYICLVGAFLMSVGISQFAPISPLYFHELGVKNPEEMSLWSGLAMGITFIMSAIVAPFWGRLADRKGRKITLLRASFGMSLCNIGLAFVQTPEQIILARFFQGLVNGFFSGSVALLASEVPKEHTGWSLGMLTSANLAGSLIGPIIGGYIASVFGIHIDFLIIGILMGIAFLSTYFFIHEDFTPAAAKEKQSLKTLYTHIPNFKTIITLYIAALIYSMCVMSLQPVMTVYIKGMVPANTANIALISGAVFSIMGVAQTMSSSYLGHMIDRIGPRRILLVSLVYVGLLTIPQAYVTNYVQLGILRFLQGLGMGGLLPSLHTYLSSLTPKQFSGQVFAYNQSMISIGFFLGAVGGSTIMASFGFTILFWVNGISFVLAALWILLKVR